MFCRVYNICRIEMYVNNNIKEKERKWVYTVKSFSQYV